MGIFVAGAGPYQQEPTSHLPRLTCRLESRPLPVRVRPA